MIANEDVLAAPATSSLNAELAGPFDRGRGGPGGWIIFGSKDEEHIVVPDLAGWRRQRMPEVPDVVFFTLAPAELELGSLWK